MIIIVDNGRNADKVAALIRGQKTVVKIGAPIPKGANAVILTDGDVKNQKANEKIIQSFDKPLLAIGNASLFLGTAEGMQIVPGKVAKNERVKIERPCAVLLDMKKMFTVMKASTHELDDLPDTLDVMASSKYPFEVIAHNEKPYFGVHFNPELGAEGMKVVQNFCGSFIEIWEKYHKGN